MRAICPKCDDSTNFIWKLRRFICQTCEHQIIGYSDIKKEFDLKAAYDRGGYSTNNNEDIQEV